MLIKSKNKLKIFAVIITCMVAIMVMYYDYMQEYNIIVDKQIESELEYGSILIKTITLENLDKANTHNKIVISDVRNTIDEKYKYDRYQLAIDLESLTNGNVNCLSGILINYIKGYYLNDIANDSNDMFWMSKTNFLADASFDCATDNKDSTIENKLLSQYDVKLAKKFIENVRNQDISNIQFWTYLESKYNIKYDDVNFNMVLNIYKSYGGDLISIDNIEILQTNYMYEKTDITGNEVIKNGIKNTSVNQLILVQGFNIVDIINNNPFYKSEFDRIMLTVKSIDENRINKINHFGIILILVILIVAISIISIGREFNNQLIIARSSCNSYEE